MPGLHRVTNFPDGSARCEDCGWLISPKSDTIKPMSEIQGVLMDVPESILAKAEKIVGGERADIYGKAEDSFGRIADLWSAYLGLEVNLKPSDVAHMMVLMKVSRSKHKYSEDNYVDQAGYALLGDRLKSNGL